MKKRTRNRAGAAFIIAAIVAATGWVNFAAATQTRGEPRPERSRMDSGRLTYVRECAGCHGLTAKGFGPDALFLRTQPANLRRREVLERYDGDKLTRWVQGSHRARLDVRPEIIRRHSAETEAVYQFLATIPGLNWEAIDWGEAIYLDRCTQCHDRFGHPQVELPPGVRSPTTDLSSAWFQASVTDEDLVELVRHGKRGMPGLVPRITETEAADLSHYVRMLSPGFELYSLYCQNCHGLRGEGAGEAHGIAVDSTVPRVAFDAQYFGQKSPEKVRRAVWHMLRDASIEMPHFSHLITDAEVKAIFEYLRSLPPDDTPANQP